MVYRLIAPIWLVETGAKRVLEGEFTNAEIKEFNTKGYNIYYLPNYPSTPDFSSPVSGANIDVFSWVFIDFDLKSGTYPSKDAFLEAVGTAGIEPSKVIDSGNGIHVYWKVVNLDVKSYLRLTRRAMRLFNSDEAVGQIFQLMRLEGTQNTKVKPFLDCSCIYTSDRVYTCDELDQVLPPILQSDEEYCQQHYDKTYNLNQNAPIDDTLPPKFGDFLRTNAEAKELWSSVQDDRSKGDFRLAHLMFANNFTKTEASSVLINSAKALQRAPLHRQSYAQNIVDKIWTHIDTEVSDTVRDILSRPDDTLKGKRFPCNKVIDDTVHGFRLGQVIGIIGGSGVGKTTLTLNTFLWFAENNPDCHHFFFSLEQPPGEIASQIKTICDGNDRLFDKIHIISNYGPDGTFKNFSLDSVREHLMSFKERTGLAIGAAVVDHIGVLSKSDKNGEMEGLQGICRRMKSVAVETNCILIMLSQAPREKAGIGDLELNKDSAFGTSYFENFVDFLITLWQPLKRVYNLGAPTVMAFKFAKIRHKKQGSDRIQEDTCYQLFFDPQTERLRELTQDEEKSAKYFNNQATTARKRDRKTDIIEYESRRVDQTEHVKSNSH